MGVAADMNFTWKMFRSHNVKKKKTTNKTPSSVWEQGQTLTHIIATCFPG